MLLIFGHSRVHPTHPQESPQLSVCESNMQEIRVAFEIISTDFPAGFSFITNWDVEQKVTWTSLCMLLSCDLSSKFVQSVVPGLC